MRNHEERMAEIRRRSDALIQERKKRRKTILTLCVPLALCLVIMGVWLLPKGTATESGLREEEGTIPEIAVGEAMERTEAMTLPAMECEIATALDSYSDYPGISVEILSVDRQTEGTSLRVRWKNDTDKEVIFGASFSIDSLQDSRWQPCKMNEGVAFPAIGYILEPGQVREEPYMLTGVYDLPERGICRFLTECFVYETESDSIRCELWTSFSLGEP